MPVSVRHAFAVAAGLAVLVALLAVTVTSWGDTSWGAADSGPPIGKTPPAFELPVVANGSDSLSLAETRGTPVVIEVFASWCKYCGDASATIAAAAGERREQKVRFVGVSLDEHPEQAARVATEWRLPYEVVHDDGTLTRGWNISALPTVIVLDANGRVRYVLKEAPSAQQLERCLRGVGARRED
jgi:peroxiredoxin